MSNPVLQLRVLEDTLARIDAARGDDTRSAWLQRLIDRELDGQTATAPPAAAPLSLPGGEPCPGVACSGPGCWQRDTARYGLRLVLCTACAAALLGYSYKRNYPKARPVLSAGRGKTGSGCAVPRPGVICTAVTD